jgi:adenylyltransferase/sulfurtransferase
MIQATEAIKLIIGRGKTLAGRLVLFNALEMKFREVKIQRDPACPLCGEKPSIKQLIDYDQFCGVGRGQEAPLHSETSGEITAQELKVLIDKKQKFTLVDVREPFEYEIAKIPGSKLIPLGKVKDRVKELDPAEDIVVHCKTGGRSAKAIGILKTLGFKKLRNLKGGITSWSENVDPSVPKY